MGVEQWMLEGLEGIVTQVLSCANCFLIMVLPEIQGSSRAEAKTKLDGKFSSSKRALFFSCWFPQSKLLSAVSSPDGVVGIKRLIFISHCGNSSLAEAFAKHFPVVCLPGLRLDQPLVCDRINSLGIGMSLKTYAKRELLFGPPK